ncbi:origin recognition complex subunit 4 C-terminus-domain-containing protein [Dichotomocladium elegans]|nr:origin recognition complex subunit 4 C-terminus-domain-containing protein [Dichotomocladium elegans]
MEDTEHFNWGNLSKFYPSSPHRQSPHRMIGSALPNSLKRGGSELRSPVSKRLHRPVISVLDDDPFADSTDPQEATPNISMADHVTRAKSHLLNRLTEKSTPTRLYGLEDQYAKLYELLDQTVDKGESNSCLIIGNRGTGKTMLVRRALEDLEKAYNRSGEPNFMVIRLNGQTESTDRIALNEIARQLFAKQKQQDLQQQGRQFASFAESFEYLLSLLKAGDKSTLPIVFILDEFDLFAQQSKQALLYNLFDAAQSAQNPMAVIGLTCRLDALSLLEKRVKSRFSHRQIYVFPPATFGDFIELARNQLRLQISLGDSSAYNAYVDKFNTELEDLFQDSTMNSILRRIFDLTKDIRGFYKLCFEPVSQLSEQEPFLRVDHFQEASIAQRCDAKTEILKGVSLLELILIVSIKKLLEKDISTFNFAMVYDEYKEFMNQTQIRGGFGMKLYKRPVALKAFENLQGFELVCPVEDIAKCPKEYRMARLMLEQTQVTEAVLKYKDCPAPIKRWATT